MAKVDAMSLMAASAKDVTAAAKNQSIRKVEGNTDSFGQYMAKRNDTSEDQNFVKVKDGVKGTEFVNGQKANYIKKKDYVSELETGNEAVMAGSVNMEQAGQIVSEIRQIVKTELSMDDATLDQTISSMGITVLDLLNPDVLKDFLLQLKDVDSTELLTDEFLLNSLQSVTELLNDFSEENQAPVLALMELLDAQMPLEEAVDPETYEAFMQQLTGGSEVSYVTPEEQNVFSEKAVVTNQVTVKSQETGVAEPAEEKEPQNSTIEKFSVVSVEHSGEKQESSQDSGMNLAQKDASESDVMTKSSGFLTETRGAEEENGTIADDLLAESDGMEIPKEVRAEEDDRMPFFTLNPQNHVVQGSVNEIAEANFQSAGRMLQALDITRQISEQMRTTLTEGTTRLEMQLNPESLGKVLLTVSAKEGMMTATFRVQTEEARQALESQMFTLKENLEAKNIKVEAVDVQISNFNFSESGETERQLKEEMEKRGKKRFDFSVADEEMEDVKTSAERVRRSVMRDQGGSIDFTA